MSSWKCPPEKSFFFPLFLALILLPLNAHGRDLYFENNEMLVTAGADHVILGNTPDDKRYTGKLMCVLGDMESLPATTWLNVNLYRSGVIVKQDQIIFSSSRWGLVSGTTDTYSILLKNISGFPTPVFSDYYFTMPTPGSAGNQLRTGSYQFNFTIGSSLTDHVLANNSFTLPAFDYTVYSGLLSVNGELQLINELTPGTSPMCNGDRYFSAISGTWTTQWWEDLFFTNELCADIRTNVNGYSTDVIVARDVAIFLPFQTTGNQWVIKGQSPPNLQLQTINFECEGTPPSTITLNTRLLSSTMEPDHELASYSQVLTPNWLMNTNRNIYYFSFTPSYSLPADGEFIADLQSGQHSFVSTISVPGDTNSSNNTDNTDFIYSVYSGLLYFNEVETTFTALTFDSNLTCTENFTVYPRITSVTGSWDDLGTFPILSSDFCATESSNPDGYSSDLNLFVGNVYLGTGSTTVNGLDIDFNNIVLDQNGGYFLSATLNLPEDVTVHQEIYGAVNPRGENSITFPGSEIFSRSLETVTLTSYSHYLHSYGLPFYISSDSFSLSLDGSSNIVGNTNMLVYVHQESVNALAGSDARSSFPSNDIVFQQGSDTSLNTVTIGPGGLTARLYIAGSSGLTRQTGFPKAKINFSPWRIDLADGQLSPSVLYNVDLAMQFGRGCPDNLCEDSAGSRWYQVHSARSMLTPTGAFGAQFTEIGPTLDQNHQDTGEDSVAWGAFSDDGTGTYVRTDRYRQGAFVVPGFLMPQTRENLTSPYRLGQILLGSYFFNDIDELGVFSPLHDTASPAATQGNGMFAGLNLGPENYTDLVSGIGTILGNQTLVKFFDAVTPKPQISMADWPSVKYVMRPGGLTGVFNTSFTGTINIYDYDLAFDRFSFRQDRNRLDGNTFIDGSLTLDEGPVANGITDNQQDFDVAFVNLDLSCDGNLGAGQVDTEPEPDWPLCEGAGLHKGCQELVYWKMPVLLTGMAFDGVPGTASAATCPTENRQLFLHSRNQIDGIGTPLTLAGFYSPKGVLHHQEFYGTVRTWFDKSSTDLSSPGFGIRLRSAFVNETGIDINGNAVMPSWDGFTILAGYTDVPLFDDVRLAGHFDNSDVDDRQVYDLYMFQDETESDGNRDGIPDTYLGDSVDSLRQRLSTEEQAGPKPFFSYSWPTENMVNLDYYAIYQRAAIDQGPTFKGMKKSSDILGVITLNSVPDYITPLRTKLSFGISADVAELQNFQLDLANYSSGGPLDEFLHSLGLPVDFTMDTILCYTPEGSTDKLCLHTLEASMLSLTGGDLTESMGDAVDAAMQQVDTTPFEGLPLAIAQATEQLNIAHQAHSQISGFFVEPLIDVKNDITDIANAQLTAELTALYSTDMQAALAVFGREQLEQMDLPPLAGVDDMLLQVELLRQKLDQLIAYLDTAITAYSQGFEMLLQPTTGVIVRLKEATVVAGNALSAVADEINNASFSDLLLNLDPTVNTLLGTVDTARQEVNKVRNAIENVDLGTLGEKLQDLATASGAAIDTSLIDDIQQTVNSSLDELDQSILQADQVIDATFASMTAPLNEMLSQLSQLFDENSLLQQNLVDIDTELNTIETRIQQQTTLIQLNSLKAGLAALRAKINGETVVPQEFAFWSQVQQSAQTLLDNEAKSFALTLLDSAGCLRQTILAAPDLNTITFPDLFNGQLFDAAMFVEAAFRDFLEADGGAAFLVALNRLHAIPSTSLPQPSEEDIRNMIRTAVLQSDPVQDLNAVFYDQFGLLSDQLDMISTQLTGRINGLIRQTINSVNEAMSAQLSAAVDSIGGWGSTVQSVGIDGHALVSQDEIERIHMDADFVFEGFPDPTSYNAALDIIALQDNNGETGCGTGESGTYYNVEISTHDVSAGMLGLSVGIKEALLGFTINSAATPIGIFGRCYLDGEIGFQSMVLEDLGLEAGIGSLQTYLAATAAGRFDDYQIPKAAFYLGKSCTTDRLGVIGRLDPDVGKFIGPEISPLFGVYLRGAADIPVWDTGCALTIGAGADLGAWYFTEPDHGTLGGLVGGSLYGRLGCLAALKGKMQCIGQVSGSKLLFDGSGWVGAGVGDCSPGSWQSISDVRRDKWCETADASFGVSYNNEFDLYDYTYNCCD